MKDQFTKSWITSNSLDVIKEYSAGELTIRALHYRLVARGMTNSLRHYKRVVNAMTTARWEGEVGFQTFSDHDREILGSTEYAETSVDEAVFEAEQSIEFWLNYYRKNRWENQPNYVEVFIEKKALLGVFKPICESNNVALGACKGYPSLTFLYDTAWRFKQARLAGKKGLILYFGDYDPSGEDIPRSLVENLSNLGETVELVRCALMEDQVLKWNLPPAPAKSGDSRTAAWEGLGQVELDAVELNTLRNLCQESIDNYFDGELYRELKEIEAEERLEYRSKIKNIFNEKL